MLVIYYELYSMSSSSYIAAAGVFSVISLTTGAYVFHDLDRLKLLMDMALKNDIGSLVYFGAAILASLFALLTAYSIFEWFTSMQNKDSNDEEEIISPRLVNSFMREGREFMSKGNMALDIYINSSLNQNYYYSQYQSYHRQQYQYQSQQSYPANPNENTNANVINNYAPQDNFGQNIK